MTKRTPETAAKDVVKATIKQVLRDLGAPPTAIKATWNAGARFGHPRLDLDGVAFGHPFAVELKRFDGKGKTTLRQRVDLAEYWAAGAFSMVIEDMIGVGLFEQFLRYCAANPTQRYLDHQNYPEDGPK